MAARSSSIEAIHEQTTHLEAYMGDSLDGDTTLSARVADAFNELSVQQGMLESQNKLLEEQVATLTTILEGFKGKIESLEGEIVVLKRVVVQGAFAASEPAPPKVRVPEPKPFSGVRNAKDLENFLWEMEQYFDAVHIPLREQVTLTTMYLFGDAKL